MVQYDYRKADLIAGQIQTGISETIQNFFVENLNSFSSTLYHSKLTTAIDDTYPFIISNVTNFFLEIRQTPTLGTNTQYNLTYSNAFSPGSVRSDLFNIDGIAYQLDDAPIGTAPYSTGVVRIYRAIGDQKIYLNTNAGPIDYVNGTITLNNVRIDSLANSTKSYFGVYVDMATPSSVDIPFLDLNVYTNGRDQLLALNPTITVNVIAEK